MRSYTQLVRINSTERKVYCVESFFPLVLFFLVLLFFLEPKSFGSADGWPASGRPAGGGAGALAKEAADGLLLSCCSEGAERGAAEQHVRAGGLMAICEHCSPGGGGEPVAGSCAVARGQAAAGWPPRERCRASAEAVSCLQGGLEWGQRWPAS